MKLGASTIWLKREKNSVFMSEFQPCGNGVLLCSFGFGLVGICGSLVGIPKYIFQGVLLCSFGFGLEGPFRRKVESFW